MDRRRHARTDEGKSCLVLGQLSVYQQTPCWQIYLPAIRGLLPNDLVRALREYLEYAYLIRQPEQTDDMLRRADEAHARYRHYREVFRHAGVRPTFSIPRQHAPTHASRHTRNFGALYGLCTSITENKHIFAVKKPWRRSSKFEALGQMLKTNERLDKLAAARVDFTGRGMLQGTCLSETLQQILDRLSDADEDAGEGDEDGQADGEAEGVEGRDAEDGGDEEEGDGAVDGPRVEAFTALAQRPGESLTNDLSDILMIEPISERLSTQRHCAWGVHWPT